MYKNKIKEKLNKIAANHVDYTELNHRPALIASEKSNQSTLFRPQRKKLSLSKELSTSSGQRHNQSTDVALQDEESRSCKKHFMRVFSNSCSKELQKAQSATLRLNHHPSTASFSKRINFQETHLPEKLVFFGNQRDNNQTHNKKSLSLSNTGSKQRIIPVLIQAISCSSKQPSHGNKAKKQVERSQSAYTIDTELKKMNSDIFQTPIRHFKTCYDEQLATFRNEETSSHRNNCAFRQEGDTFKNTSRFNLAQQQPQSKAQKNNQFSIPQNLCKQNIFLEHSNRLVSPKYQNQHRIEHSPAPIIRGSTEASLQLRQLHNRPLAFEQMSTKQTATHLPISREIELVQEQRRQIESRISKKLDQLSERASQIARMCKGGDRERGDEQQHKKPKILMSNSRKDIKHPVMETPYHRKQAESLTLKSTSSDFVSPKVARQPSNYLLNSANGSLRHQILNRIYS